MVICEREVLEAQERIGQPIVALMLVYGLGPKASFLLAPRNSPPFPGLYAPVVGKLKAGENPEKGALRELKEETGLRRCWPKKKLVGIEPLNYPYAGRPDFTCTSYLFEARYRRRTQELEPDKQGPWQWFSFEEMTYLC